MPRGNKTAQSQQQKQAQAKPIVFKNLGDQLLDIGAYAEHLGMDIDRDAVRRAIAEAGDPDQRCGVNQNTPLILATGRGYRAIVEELLAAGADPLVKNKDGQDVISFARLLKRTEIETLVKDHLEKSSQAKREKGEAERLKEKFMTAQYQKGLPLLREITVAKRVSFKTTGPG